jgi:hypothetical protein
MEPVTTGATGRRWLTVCVGLLVVASSMYIYFRFARNPQSPSVLVVSNCKVLQPGMRRMGDRGGYQFDALGADFEIIEGTQDAGPGHGFDLRPTNSTALLTISFGSDLGRGPIDADPNLVFSERYYKRRIFDNKGQLIGEDYWGYLDRQKIWRRIHLKGFVYLNYANTNEIDAERFDQVINSACVLSVEGESP